MYEHSIILDKLVKVRQDLIDQREFIYENEYSKDSFLDSDMEALASIGDCPTVLYDDNGNFAIGSTGFQNVTWLKNLKDDDDVSFNGFWSLLKKDWKPNIKQTMNHYIRTQYLDEHVADE